MGYSKNPSSKALVAESSWVRRKLRGILQQLLGNLWNLQITPSSSVVRWYPQMQLAENRGLTMLLLTFGLEKIADWEFKPEAFHLECAASVLKPRLKISFNHLLTVEVNSCTRGSRAIGGIEGHIHSHRHAWTSCCIQSPHHWCLLQLYLCACTSFLKPKAQIVDFVSKSCPGPLLLPDTSNPGAKSISLADAPAGITGRESPRCLPPLLPWMCPSANTLQGLTWISCGNVSCSKIKVIYCNTSWLWESPVWEGEMSMFQECFK